MLSNHHPVGAMVYNNSSLLGVPWETILKLFRKNLASQSFPTLVEYGKHLLKYLNEAENLFPKQIQERHYQISLQTFYENIEEEIRERIEKEIFAAPADGKDDAEQVRKIAAEVINQALSNWRAESPTLTGSPTLDPTWPVVCPLRSIT